MIQALQQSRYKFVAHYLLIAIIISTITRTTLLFYSFEHFDLDIISLLTVYIVGAFYALISASYFVLPAVVYLTFMPLKILRTPWHHKLSLVVYFVTLVFFIYIAVSEWFFWEEFNVRFNFISVDYLVYTNEVIGNINESYPMPTIATTIVSVSLILVFLANRYKIISCGVEKDMSWKQRLSTLSGLFLLPVVLFYSFSQSQVSKNQFNTELAKDGLFSFFSAFRNNKLDYGKFYKTLPEQEMLSHVRDVLKTKDSHYLNDGGDITRIVKRVGEEKHHNVMMIVVESLSAEHIGALGGTRKISPELDKLADKSLFFRNFYATGTRTIRGMEALTLSVPPTPGRSIVKRPNNENMFSSGFLFQERGYDTKFIYGGYGYFDNMNAFFSTNGFSIVDRSDFSEEEDTFHTTWGVCDEDLFNKTLKEADKSFSEGKPFMSFVMTTSNHRPFRYPSGRIDIPSPSKRNGGVKYTDYAIGKFLEDAKSKPWFDDTIFIIVADHCAGRAGSMELPVYAYHIPMYMYAPKLIKPKNVDTLSSQIDLMPTLFGILNWSYESKFYGDDIFNKHFKPRALIANYQKLGLYKDGVLDVLLPKKGMTSYKVSKETLKSAKYEEIPTDKDREKDAISIYHSATYLYDKKLNRYESKVKSK
jgi:phosphoglycerol transferase MdoB-like AlkP superfamily enzyme